jgi:hypothetical protein
MNLNVLLKSSFSSKCRYLVLANMLMESEVNPFDGQEAKPYKNDPEILAMTNLVAAYQRNEILEFEKILKVCYSVFLMNSGCM